MTSNRFARRAVGTGALALSLAWLPLARADETLPPTVAVPAVLPAPVVPPAAVAPPPVVPPSEEEVRLRALVDDLGSSHPTTRATAERELRAYGPAAHAALHAATAHDDLDVRLRARDILRDPAGKISGAEAAKGARDAAAAAAKAAIRPYDAGTTERGMTRKGTTDQGTTTKGQTERGTTNQGTTTRGTTVSGSTGNLGRTLATGAQPITIPAFGLALRELDADFRREANLRDQQGAYVSGVTPGSRGARLGLRKGDMVTSVNGQAVRDAADLEARLRDVRDADSVAFAAVRAGQALTLRR